VAGRLKDELHHPVSITELQIDLSQLTMKRNTSGLALAFLASAGLAVGETMNTVNNPAHVDVYVTPYYNSAGPTIDVGPFSKGLNASNDAEFVGTISKMKESWNHLNFAEMYVGAICLYDRGFRNEAVYWFYSAQYRGRLFVSLLDEAKMGSIGDPGFELAHAANAFQQLVGQYINGYAFGHIDDLALILERAQKEGKAIPDLNRVYPGVNFKNRSEWEMLNKELNEGMGGLLGMLKEQRADIKQQRVESGIEARFSKLTSKNLPNGSSH
jgi:hypothetical protein